MLLAAASLPPREEAICFETGPSHISAIHPRKQFNNSDIITRLFTYRLPLAFRPNAVLPSVHDLKKKLLNKPNDICFKHSFHQFFLESPFFSHGTSPEIDA